MNVSVTGFTDFLKRLFYDTDHLNSNLAVHVTASLGIRDGKLAIAVNLLSSMNFSYIYLHISYYNEK